MDKTESILLLQKHVRKWIGKRKYRKKVNEKDFDLAMKKAYVEMVRRQQAVEDRRNRRLDEQRRRKIEFNKYRKKVLEAAYDGDVATLKQVFTEVQNKEIKDEEASMLEESGRGKASAPKKPVPAKFQKLTGSRRVRALVDCEDPNGNSPISEAAAGGSVDVIKLLISLEANPNSRGRFERTPLWRASFCGHMDAVQVLLENGGDPRLYASDGQTPEQVAPNESMRQIFENWNIAQTDAMTAVIDRIKDRHKKEMAELQQARCDQIDEQIAIAEKEIDLRTQKICSCKAGVNRRYKVVDATHPLFEVEKAELARTALNDAELELESAKVELEKARGRLAALRLRRREVERDDEDEKQPARKSNEIRINLKELEEVLFRDVGGKLGNSDKWPMLIDASEQSATFLRYRDTNYIHAMNPLQMRPETIRLAILGAVRYGKPFVLDLMENDSLINSSVKVRFDEVQKGLLEKLVKKREFLDEEVYLDLIKKSDGAEYAPTAFNPFRINEFKFIVVTSNPVPAKDTGDKFLPIRIMTEFSSFMDPTVAGETSGGAEWF